MSVHGSSEAAASSGDADPRGDWWDSVLTIASTIGGIANVLSGARGGGTDVVDFGPLGRGESPHIGDIVFWNEKNGETWVLNKNTEEEVTLFFPTDLEEEEGEMLILPQGEKAPVSPFFRGHARVDRLAITPTRSGDDTESPAAGNPKVRASTRQLVNSQLWVKLGSCFNVKVVASDRTVRVVATGAIVLVGIALFRIRDVCGGVVEIVSAWKKPPDADDKIEAAITIPAGIDLTNAIDEIEIVAEITALPPNEGGPSERSIVPITAEDYERLERVEAARRA